jgi:hypothetical protein
VRLTARSSTFEEVPVWSPDGSQIAFERLDKEQCTMSTVSSLGGAEREVGGCQNYMVHYFDWYHEWQGTDQRTEYRRAFDNMVLMRWDPRDRNQRSAEVRTHTGRAGSRSAFFARRQIHCVPARARPVQRPVHHAAAGGAVRQLTQLHSRIRGLAWTRDSAA